MLFILQDLLLIFSTVNLCALDVSKAFDKINHYALFMKLMDRCVPIAIILTLKCWYDKVYTVVKWNVTFSRSVRLIAGVRQREVLSPLLFAIYVDDILFKLSKSSLGCNISRVCYNSIMYADDLLLFALSLKDLQAMVDMCVLEFDSLDLNINIKKSMCLRIGPRHNEELIESIDIRGIKLEWKREIRYLGVFIPAANNFKYNF